MRRRLGWHPLRWAFLVTALALVSAGCSRVAPVSSSIAPSPPPSPGWSDVGVASWYGNPFHGRLTASGEVYDMEGMTAAHRTLPFGTVVRVENLTNGRATVVTVNDRGPFVDDREIDLSRRAARELDMIGSGTAAVRLTVVEAPTPASCWVVQVGAFDDPETATAVRDRMASRGVDTLVSQAPEGAHRVRAGPFDRREDAERLASEERGVLLGCGSTPA